MFGENDARRSAAPISSAKAVKRWRKISRAMASGLVWVLKVVGFPKILSQLGY
jgi:hypothetical protein